MLKSPYLGALLFCRNSMHTHKLFHRTAPKNSCEVFTLKTTTAGLCSEVPVGLFTTTYIRLMQSCTFVFNTEYIVYRTAVEDN